MEVPRRPPLADDLTICDSDVSRRNHTTREGGKGGRGGGAHTWSSKAPWSSRGGLLGFRWFLCPRREGLVFPPRLIHPAPKLPAPPVRRCGSFPETLITGCCAGGPDEGKLLQLLLGFAQMLAGGCELEDMATSRWDDTPTVVWAQTERTATRGKEGSKGYLEMGVRRVGWHALRSTRPTSGQVSRRKAGDPTHHTER